MICRRVLKESCFSKALSQPEISGRRSWISEETGSFNSESYIHRSRRVGGVKKTGVFETRRCHPVIAVLAPPARLCDSNHSVDTEDTIAYGIAPFALFGDLLSSRARKLMCFKPQI